MGVGLILAYLLAPVRVIGYTRVTESASDARMRTTPLPKTPTVLDRTLAAGSAAVHMTEEPARPVPGGYQLSGTVDLQVAVERAPFQVRGIMQAMVDIHDPYGPLPIDVVVDEHGRVTTLAFDHHNDPERFGDPDGEGRVTRFSVELYDFGIQDPVEVPSGEDLREL